jgi:hypothetical protein
MTFREEFAALRERLAKAELDRDTWRTSGMQEKYLEAYSAVEALELQLEQLRQQGLQALGKESPAVATPAAAPDPAAARQRLMVELGITYNGRHYHYDRYRYERLVDAVDYARLQSALPASSRNLDPVPQVEERVQAPNDTQRELMAELGITYEHGVYRLGDYRYHRLADAVNYARLLRLQGRRM